MRPLKSWQTLGDYLRRERIKRGLMQFELAQRLSWPSPQKVSRIERGLQTLSAREAPRYAAALGIENSDAICRLITQ